MNGSDDGMTNDLISVIVPIYKVEKYLCRCIESIINQDYNNLEIILVDDGSPDNCHRICDEFAAKDERIRVIHKTNGGLSSARNIGIEAASGEYILLVDADDYIKWNMAGYLLNLIQKDNTDLAICSFRYVDESGNQTRDDLQAYCPLQNGILYRNELFALINTNIPGYWFYSVPMNKLYKSNILKKLKYPESYIYEDEFIIHHLFGAIRSASISDKYLYMYTQRPDSITKRNGYDTLKKMDFVYALEDRYHYFRRNKYNTYAKDTADLLYTVFLKIVKNAFKRRNDYLEYFGKMANISFILLCEFKKSGIKLPVVYFKNFIKLCLRRAND